MLVEKLKLKGRHDLPLNEKKRQHTSTIESQHVFTDIHLFVFIITILIPPLYPEKEGSKTAAVYSKKQLRCIEKYRSDG